MKARWLTGTVLMITLLTLASPAAAGQGDKIVRVKPGLNGLSVINTVCHLVGCTVLGSLDTPPESSSQPSSLFLVGGLMDTTVTLLLSLLGLATI